MNTYRRHQCSPIGSYVFWLQANYSYSVGKYLMITIKNLSVTAPASEIINKESRYAAGFSVGDTRTVEELGLKQNADAEDECQPGK